MGIAKTKTRFDFQARDTACPARRLRWLDGGQLRMTRAGTEWTLITSVFTKRIATLEAGFCKIEHINNNTKLLHVAREIMLGVNLRK